MHQQDIIMLHRTWYHLKILVKLWDLEIFFIGLQNDLPDADGNTGHFYSILITSYMPSSICNKYDNTWPELQSNRPSHLEKIVQSASAVIRHAQNNVFVYLVCWCVSHFRNVKLITSE